MKSNFIDIRIKNEKQFQPSPMEGTWENWNLSIFVCLWKQHWNNSHLNGRYVR